MACKHLAIRGDRCSKCGAAVFNDGHAHYQPENGLEALAAREAAPMAPAPAAIKPRPDLLPAGALLAAGRCMAGRMDRDDEQAPGYLTIPASKYRASLLRHVLAYLDGERVDPESGESALAHVISNAAILWEKARREEESGGE